MKKFLTIISIILCFFLVSQTFISCRKNNSISELDSLDICDNSISKYKIIYASPDSEATKWENYYFGIDYKFDQMSAIELGQQLKQIFGVDLEIFSDVDTEVSEFEILVGKTNREETQKLGLDKLSPEERYCQVYNNKLIMCGGSYSSTYHCIDFLINEIKNQSQNGNTIISIDNSFKFTDIYLPESIAVIGDDTFLRSTTSDTVRLSVPSVIQRLLWQDYSVSSYLEGDSTVRSDLAQGLKFISTDSYKSLLKNCLSIDHVIINLGTFDQKYCNGPWDSTDDAMFISSYQTIIEELNSINGNLHFYICTTAKSNNDNSIIEAQIKLCNRLTELGYNVTLVELDSLFGKYISADDYINNIYPNEYASAIIAKRIVAEIIK